MNKIEKKVSNTLKEGEHGEPTIMRRFKIQFDLDYTGSNGVNIPSQSETVPDMNLTVRQLLENHTRGVNGQTSVRQPLYFDTVIPNIKDLTDVDNYKKYLNERLAYVEEFLKNEQKLKDAEREKEKTSRANEAGQNTTKEE